MQKVFGGEMFKIFELASFRKAFFGALIFSLLANIARPTLK